MAYYYRCPDCGAHLDPGEECDCIINSDELTVEIKKAPEKVTISTGANAKDGIQIAISLYYKNNQKSRRRLR